MIEAGDATIARRVWQAGRVVTALLDPVVRIQKKEGLLFYWSEVNLRQGHRDDTPTTMSESDIDPPEDIPTEVIQTLGESSDRQLREIIHYAQQLLREHPPLTEAIEAREGEELIRIDDQGGCTTVIVKRPDETGEARGPFAFRVKWEPGVEEDDGHYRWHYLGRVAEEVKET